MLYWFKPNGHWNVIPKEVYDELRRFYGDDMLRETEEEKK